MSTPFTLIQGGLTQGAPAADAVSLRAELRHPASLREPEVEAWRSLMARALDPSVYADPDFALTMAQHLADGQTLAVLLVWQDGARAPILRGALPLRLPAHQAMAGRARLWRLPLAGSAEAAINAGYASAVLRAALDHLRGSPLHLVDLLWPDLRPDSALAVALGEAAGGTGRRLTLAEQAAPRAAVPAPLTLPAGRTSLERVRDPARLRDAVEHFLVLDARRGADSLLADPATATAFRVVTRRFAHRRQACVDLVRRDGEVVAAAIHLATGRHDTIWRQAGLCLAQAPVSAAAPARIEAVVTVERAGTVRAPRQRTDLRRLLRLRA
ncbi:GNAT family N-acetyltransferase [Methylobacterium indicum]|uniref:GNAT family N-acetyltransferase n=1 Tax=Methylobacterium indicum TaxID=1775910 RepID=UPI002434C741|nr:GNAT family N-acetyltransferase [Methylobacterium indicum]